MTAIKVGMRVTSRERDLRDLRGTVLEVDAATRTPTALVRWTGITPSDQRHSVLALVEATESGTLPPVAHRLVEVQPSDIVADGRAPSNHTCKPSRAILIGDKVASATDQGEGVVIAYHDGRLVVAWPPQVHATDDVWLSERAPENVAKHEELMR